MSKKTTSQRKKVQKRKGYTSVETTKYTHDKRGFWSRLTRLLGARFKFFGCATNVFTFLVVFITAVALVICYFVWWK